MKRKNASDDPVRTTRIPLCYTCGVAIDAPGDCARCQEAHLKRLHRTLAQVKAHPVRAKGMAISPEKAAELAHEHAEIRRRMAESEVPF